LVDLFGRVRDDWIENDLSGWIDANRWLIYETLIISSFFETVQQGRPPTVVNYIKKILVWPIYFQRN
jgi:hypothetical protein